MGLYYSSKKLVYIKKGLHANMSQEVSRRRIEEEKSGERSGERRGRIMMKRSSSTEWLSKAKPYLLMIGLQFGMAGNYIFGKDFLDRGMSRFVFIVYRNSMASLFLAPFAFFLERSLPPSIYL